MWLSAAGAAVVVILVVFVLGVKFGRAVERDVQAKLHQVNIWAKGEKEKAEADLRKLV